MNFTLTLTAASLAQKLVWVDSLRWLKFLFQAKSDLSSVAKRGLDICASQTQALNGDASDEYLCPRHYRCVIYQGAPYARGFPRTLTARNAS